MGDLPDKFFGLAVEIFERRSFDVEVSSFLACPANGRTCARQQHPKLTGTYPLVLGTQWLREWEVDTLVMKPIVLQKYIQRDWETGCVSVQHGLDDYEAVWGNVHYLFHRQDMHKCLLNTATSGRGKGIPCKLVIDHT